jgi:Ca-activated chloride channel family protein
VNELAGPGLAFRLLDEPVRLLEPGALRLLLVVAALAALGALSLWWRRRALARAAGPQAARVAPAAGLLRPARRWALSLGGLALLSAALARPQCSGRTAGAAGARRLGVDLVVALDVSRSMLARDVGPDRLTRARLELEALTSDLGGDRVGLVLFAGAAVAACPLTTDLDALHLFLRGAGPDAVPAPGTDVAAALRRAGEVLRSADRGARSQVVLLVSDGGALAPGAAEAAAELSRSGVRVFALGVGGPEGAPIPIADEAGRVTGYKKDGRGQTVITRLEEPALAAVAAKGGGEVFVLARPDRGIEAFRAALDKLARSERAGVAALAWDDQYALFAFPGFLLLLAALLVPEARRVAP